MDKNKLNTSELRTKIVKGLDLAFEKLVRKKKQEDGEFVFSRNGKVIIVKARDLSE